MIFSRMTLPADPAIQLPAGSLALLEAMSVIQEHTSIPIVTPDKLTTEEVVDILTTERLLRDGAVEGTWNRSTIVFKPEAPDDVLDGIDPDGAFLFGDYEWIVTIGQVSTLGTVLPDCVPSADRAGPIPGRRQSTGRV